MIVAMSYFIFRFDTHDIDQFFNDFVYVFRFKILDTAMLIDRLLRRNLHDVATSVTKLLRIPPEEGENRILVQWAVKEVSYTNNSSFISVLIDEFQLVDPSNTNEEAIANKIKNRLADVPGIPFIDIIKEAHKLKKYSVVRGVR